MKKIVFFLSVGFAGMDGVEFASYPDDISDDDLNMEAYRWAVEHAESYGYYPQGEYPDEEGEEYVDSIEGWWEVYDPVKHDGKAVGGIPVFSDC